MFYYLYISTLPNKIYLPHFVEGALTRAVLGCCAGAWLRTLLSAGSNVGFTDDSVAEPLSGGRGVCFVADVVLCLFSDTSSVGCIVETVASLLPVPSAAMEGTRAFGGVLGPVFTALD